MYQDPILHTIMNLLNEYGPKKLKGRWTIGDSLAIPKNALPHGFIAYESQAISDIANGELRNDCYIVISVAVDMTRELQVPTDRSDSHEQVVELLAGKDPSTFLFRRDSVIGALREHQELDHDHNLWIEVGSETTIEYGVGLEKRGAGIVTAEGLLRFKLTNDQVIPPYS